MAEFRLRPKARADLEDIWRYTAGRWSVRQADAYIEQLSDTMQALAEEALPGQAADDLRRGYRRWTTGSHVIFFVVVADGIEVVRVLHGAMDFLSHLEDE